MPVSQPDLFDALKESVARARRGDPSTSHQAAAKQWGGAKAEVYRVLSECSWGLTAQEVCDRLPGFHPPTVVSALSRLRTQHHLTEDTGARRPSATGTDQIVWRLKP